MIPFTISKIILVYLVYMYKYLDCIFVLCLAYLYFLVYITKTYLLLFSWTQIIPKVYNNFSIISYLMYLFSPVWRWNRLISAELDPDLSHIEKSCIAYRKFPTNINVKIIKLIPVLLAQAYGPTGLTKLYSKLFFYFINCGKLSKIRCDKFVIT